MWQDPLSVRFLLARLLTAGVSRPGACRTPLGLNLKLLRPPPHLVQPVALFLRPEKPGVCVLPRPLGDRVSGQNPTCSRPVAVGPGDKWASGISWDHNFRETCEAGVPQPPYIPRSPGRDFRPPRVLSFLALGICLRCLSFSSGEWDG